MFLRKNRRIKDGKSHYYWSIVETYRTAKGPRQRIVGYLGELDKSGEGGYIKLVDRLCGRRYDQPDLFKQTTSETQVSIYPEQVQIERVRDFGDAWTGVGLWNLLKLNDFFEQLIRKGKEEISIATIICYLVVSRLIEPRSKLAISEQFTDRSALSDILGIDPMKINKDRLYRSMDELLQHKQRLTVHLKQRYSELFQLDYDLLLYDMTSTYFEGECSLNPKAKRGYSRDNRSDCKQVTLALVVTREGLPLYFEVFDGNRRDVTTLEEVVEFVENIYGKAERIWAMDRGMVSEDTLKWLRGRGSVYIVGTPKSMLKKFEQKMLDRDWESVYPDLEVKKILQEEYSDEVFVLCRSLSRREKERSITKLFVERIEDGLKKLSIAVSRENRPLRDRDTLQRKIGALLKSNSRVARLFEINVTSIGDRAKLKIEWIKKEPQSDWCELTAGCYLLRSNISESKMSATEIWKAYIGLTEVEDAFRITKQELGLRPVWHQTEDRVDSHIFICFLSLVLQRTLEQGLVAKGLGRSTRKVLEELNTLKSMDVILPTTDGKKLKLRIISNPDPALSILLKHLNLYPPKRLCLSQNVVSKINTHPERFQPLNPIFLS